MKNVNLIMVLLLVLLCLNLRIINFVGIGINDDIAYIQNARSLAQGDNPIKTGFNQLGFRLGMVFPLAILYSIFGYNEAGFCLYPLFCSVLTCALIYLTAVRLWGIGAGVFACLLQITYPLQLVFGTQLSPSNQHATCVAAALFFYFLATFCKKEQTIESVVTTENNQILSFAAYVVKFPWLFKLKEPALLMLCGICLGLGWMINVLFATFAFLVIPFLFISRPKIKHLLWILSGFALVFVIELIIVKLACGHWFARLTCILKTEDIVESNINYWYYPRALFKIWNADPFNDEGHFGVIWYVFVIVTILAILFRDKIATSLALGCWLWMAWMQWGIQSPDGDPIAKYIRYISMIVPVQCLAFGAVLWHLTKFSKIISKVTIVLFAVMLIHLIWVGTHTVQAVKMHTKDFKEIARYFLNMNLDDDDIIYTDDLTGNFIKLYSKGALSVKKVNFKHVEFPQNGYLVKDGSWYAVFLKEYRDAMPQWSLSPPEHWELLYTIHGKKAGIYACFDPKIYKIVPKKTDAQ